MSSFTDKPQGELFTYKTDLKVILPILIRSNHFTDCTWNLIGNQPESFYMTKL